jgi:Mg-chelatase subunit ChlD
MRAPAIALLALLCGAAHARAADGNAVFVLDASGSMWARLEGRPKIEIAREVLTGALRDLPASVAVGLVAYGHRREADCEDIELLAPVGKQGVEALALAVRALRPRGRTPITRALQVATEHARTLSGPVTIVLVSDGEETCGGDPCAAARALRGQGITLTVHVVGFDVTEAEREQLSCIAEGGGGTYFGAASAGELAQALGAVTGKVAQAATGQRATRSAFEGDAEGWKVVGDARLDRTVDPTLDQGALKAVDSATGGIWYWQAPASYHGDKRAAFGTDLRFRLRNTAVKQRFKAPDVVLEGGGLTLVFDLADDPGTEWTDYRVPLARSGWTHRASGKPASDPDLLKALGAVQNLLIRGEYNTGPDTGWLDDVVFGAPRR